MRRNIGVRSVTSLLCLLTASLVLVGCGSLGSWGEDESNEGSAEATRVIEVMEGAPTEPAQPGEQLMSIQTAPSETIGMLAVDAADPKSEYGVDFQPYGVGPGGREAGSLVILVTASHPIDVEHPFEFTGRNVLVQVDPDTWDLVSEGGEYSGVITLTQQGDKLQPMLTDVETSE